MQVHELKCSPGFFWPLASKEKTFEVRNNDRDFQIGDLLIIREWNKEEEDFTNRLCVRQITYILDHPLFVIKGMVILGLKITN